MPGTVFKTIADGGHNDTPIKGDAVYYAFISSFLATLPSGPPAFAPPSPARSRSDSVSTDGDDELTFTLQVKVPLRAHAAADRGMRVLTERALCFGSWTQR